jgi:hypothetical protein
MAQSVVEEGLSVTALLGAFSSEGETGSRCKKTRQTKGVEPGFDSIKTG